MKGILVIHGNNGKKTSYKQQLLKEMTTLKSSNPKLYWDILTKKVWLELVHEPPLTEGIMLL